MNLPQLYEGDYSHFHCCPIHHRAVSIDSAPFSQIKQTVSRKVKGKRLEHHDIVDISHQVHMAKSTHRGEYSKHLQPAAILEFTTRPTFSHLEHPKRIKPVTEFLYPQEHHPKEIPAFLHSQSLSISTPSILGGGVVPAIVNTFQQVEYKNQDCELIMERDGQQLDKMQINHSILKPRNCFGHSKNWSYLPQFKLLTLHCEGESTTTTVSWLPRKTQSVIVLAFQSRCQGTYISSVASTSIPSLSVETSSSASN